MWKNEVQAVGDFKIFTWYPKKLYSRFKRLRASWTYMTKKERHQAEFLRPKRWFKKKDWKTTKSFKVWAMTTSNGKVLCFGVPTPFDANQWAALVKKRVVPFLKRSFPDRASFKLLVDSENLLHAPVVKRAYREGNIEVLSSWPKYTPELNPQENVWPVAENTLRAKEGDGGETFEVFKTFVVKSVQEYPGAKNIVGGMVVKIDECLKTKGSYIHS